METDSKVGGALLEGVRVLELGNLIAAPTAGRILGEFGAEIIKIERPGAGDQVRAWRREGSEASLLWRTLGRNKRSVTVDVTTPEGADIVRRLAATADVVLENNPPGKLESWGLGPDVLRAANPELVIVRISGFGQTGPYRSRPGFGAIAEAVGGVRSLTGYPDRPPTRIGISLGDTVAGLYGVIGALLGLLARGHGTAKGETVDVALHEAVFSLMESLVPDFTGYGVVRTRSGNELPGIAPSNTYRCADDEWVVIGGNSDGVFDRLMRAIGRPELADDARLRDNHGRVAHREELDAAISAWTAGRSAEDAVAALVAALVPAERIFSAADIVSDPHFAARDMLLDFDVPVGGGVRTVTFPGVVPKLEHQPGRVAWIGSELGAETRAVLTEVLDMSPEDIDDLERRGVV